jgi:predicted amidohydrolase YtcJ
MIDGRISSINPIKSRHLTPDGAAYDLAGKLVVPGFNDCHMHILPYGLKLTEADLSPQAGVSDVPTLIAALQKWRTANPDKVWIRGSRYDQNIFPGAQHPTRYDLDRAFPDDPAMLAQSSGHAGTCNSVALRLAGITRDTPDPPGGQIVRDAQGEPTGVLLETAQDLVIEAAPKPSRSQMTDAILEACRVLATKGITSASDLCTGWFDVEDEISAYRQAAEAGAPVRMTLFPDLPALGQPNDIPDAISFAHDHRLSFNKAAIDPKPDNRQSAIDNAPRLGCAKLFSDGALTVRTAALREPYVDGSGSGMLLHEPDELCAYILAAHRGGWQIATHAIGDRAIELVIDCYEAAGSTKGRRHRIEHAMLADDALIQRMAALELLAVLQPEFLTRYGDAYVLGLGEQRANGINPARSLMNAGVPVSFSSDCPIVPGAPLDGIRAAFSRRAPSGRILGESERTSRIEALRNYTYWAAHASFDETETGSIEVGKRADLVVLDCEPGSLEAGSIEDALAGASVTATVFDGEVTYGSL